MQFTQMQRGVYCLTFDKGWLDKGLIIELKIPVGKSRKAVSGWLRTARVASSGMLKILRLRRLPGATVTLLKQEENFGVSVREDSPFVYLE